MIDAGGGARLPGGGGLPAWTRHGWWLAPVLLALLIYLPTIGGDWTMDDDVAVRAHPVVSGAAPLIEAFQREFWGRPLADGWSSSYRPLATLSWALEARLMPGPWLHRLGGVLAYAALCGVVAALARALAGVRAAWIAGLAFAVAPVHADNAASIVGRADVLAALGAIAAFLAMRTAAGAARDGHPRRAVRLATLAAAAYLAALLCKETVALLPAIAAWLLWIEHRDASGRHRALAVALAPTAIAGAVYLAARQALLPVGLPPSFVAADNILLALPALERLELRTGLIGEALGQLGAGLRLCSDHTYADLLAPELPAGRGAVGFYVGAAALIAGLVDGALAIRRRSRGLWFAACIAYALVGQWIIDLSVLAAERLLLWPSVWIAIALGDAAARADTLRRGWIAPAGFVAWLAIMAALAFDHGQDWTDRVRLHQRSVDRCPAAVHNRLNLAQELAARGDVPAALWHFGVAAAGQQAFPAPWSPAAFAEERSGIRPTSLVKLPSLVGADDAAAWWRGLHGVLVRGGHLAEAELARRLAEGFDPTTGAAQTR